MHNRKSCEEQALALPCEGQHALLSQSCDTQDVAATLQEDFHLVQASLKNPKPETNGMEASEEQALSLPYAVQHALPSKPCDAQNVLVRLQEDLQFEKTSPENPEPETKGMETREEQALALPCAVQDALLSQSCDAQGVVARLQEVLHLEQASLENPEPETKRMIRCLATKAKYLSRLDVVKHLRDVTPAGTTGIKCI